MQNSTSSSAAEVAALQRVALERLAWARGLTHGLLTGFTDEQLLVRAGGRGNHALWFMGHLAQTDDAILSAVTGEPAQLPETYRKLFGENREPTTDANDYPSRTKLTETMESTRRRVIAWVESLDETTAFAPTPAGLQRFAPDQITTAYALVAHEMMHAGQVTSIRAVLDMPRLLR